MAKVGEVLSVLAQKGYQRLPRYKSERSGAVFARLTSSENFNLFRNRTLPLDGRLPQMLDYIQASNRVLKLYLAGFLKKEIRDCEMVELLGATLGATVVLLELFDEFVPTIKKDDPSYKVRMEGIETMRRGLASMVTGTIESLTEADHYRASERVRLLGFMQETVPQIFQHLPPATRTEVLLRLEAMQSDPALKELQPGLGKLHSKLTARHQGERGQ